MNNKKLYVRGLFFGVLFFSGMGYNFAAVDIGAFVGNSDGRAPTAAEVRSFETLAGRNVNSLLFYWTWGEGNLPTADLLNSVRFHDGYDTRTILHLTWEPWSRLGGNDTTFTLSNIIRGDYDGYITQFARDCKSWGQAVRLRFMHEMITPTPADAKWYPWQNNPSEYRQTWAHVRQIFAREGADNVEFVWAPNNFPFAYETLRDYYPGEDLVDWLGMDGYNAGEDGLPGYPYWQNFDDIFFNLYNLFLAHGIAGEFGLNKKIMVAEFASAAENEWSPETKAQWILNAFSRMQAAYPEIDAFYWFHTLKEADWRINSSLESQAAFQTAISSDYFVSHPVPEPATWFLFLSGLGFMSINLKEKVFKRNKI